MIAKVEGRIGGDRDKFLESVAECITAEAIQAIIIVQYQNRSIAWDVLNHEQTNHTTVALLEWVKLRIFTDAQNLTGIMDDGK